MPKNGYVYILTNKTRSILCTGVTDKLPQRIRELRSGVGLKAGINATELVYYEPAANLRSAIAREKQIRTDSRRKKLDLIDAMNPEWRDLTEETR